MHISCLLSKKWLGGGGGGASFWPEGCGKLNTQRDSEK